MRVIRLGAIISAVIGAVRYNITGKSTVFHTSALSDFLSLTDNCHISLTINYTDWLAVNKSLARPHSNIGISGNIFFCLWFSGISYNNNKKKQYFTALGIA